MIPINLADPVLRAALRATLTEGGQAPPRPEVGQPCFVKMPSGPPLTGEPAYLVASMRWLLHEALVLLDAKKVGMQ